MAFLLVQTNVAEVGHKIDCSVFLIRVIKRNLANNIKRTKFNHFLCMLRRQDILHILELLLVKDFLFEQFLQSLNLLDFTTLVTEQPSITICNQFTHHSLYNINSLLDLAILVHLSHIGLVQYFMIVFQVKVPLLVQANGSFETLAVFDDVLFGRLLIQWQSNCIHANSKSCVVLGCIDYC